MIVVMEAEAEEGPAAATLHEIVRGARVHDLQQDRATGTPRATTGQRKSKAVDFQSSLPARGDLEVSASCCAGTGSPIWGGKCAARTARRVSE